MLYSSISASEPPPDVAFLEFLAEWGSEEAGTILDQEMARPQTAPDEQQQESDDE